jgi:arylsulfatase
MTAGPFERSAATDTSISSTSRPNFVVIVADDMGFSDAGCYGGEIRTPNIDGLAADGLRFTQAYSTARCWPSRACLLTGYYAQQVRMDPPEGRLPGWARVLPHYLQPAGYRCYHSGKWHLTGAPKVVADGGFDRSYVMHDHDRYFAPQEHELDDVPLPPVRRDAGFYQTIAFADRAIGFLEEHRQRHGEDPFCMYLAFTSPHFPLHAIREDIERYRDQYLEGWDETRARRWDKMTRMGLIGNPLPPPDTEVVPEWNLTPEALAADIGPGEAARAVPWDTLNEEQQRFQATKMAIHAAMVDRMDQEIGRVLAQVRAMGAWDNTVVLFVSDNGASAEQIIRGDMHDREAEPGSAATFLCLGPGWSTSSNTPFRLHKSWVHEGGISSPLVVHWPAGITARGELRHDLCHFIDLIPTLTDLAGVQPEPTWRGVDAPPMPGISLRPAFARDGAVTREELYFHHIGNRAIRMGDWKLVCAAKGPWELYDLSTDRGEMHDLAAQFPERVREMAARWQVLEERFREQAGRF